MVWAKKPPPPPPVSYWVNQYISLIVEAPNDKNLFTESNLGDSFRVMSSFIQVVIFQNELQSVEWKSESP